MKSLVFMSKVQIWAIKLLIVDFEFPSDYNRFILNLTNHEIRTFKVDFFEEKLLLLLNYRGYPAPSSGLGVEMMAIPSLHHRGEFTKKFRRYSLSCFDME